MRAFALSTLCSVAAASSLFEDLINVIDSQAQGKFNRNLVTICPKTSLHHAMTPYLVHEFPAARVAICGNSNVGLLLCSPSACPVDLQTAPVYLLDLDSLPRSFQPEKITSDFRFRKVQLKWLETPMSSNTDSSKYPSDGLAVLGTLRVERKVHGLILGLKDGLNVNSGRMALSAYLEELKGNTQEKLMNLYSCVVAQLVLHVSEEMKSGYILTKFETEISDSRSSLMVKMDQQFNLDDTTSCAVVDFSNQTPPKSVNSVSVDGLSYRLVFQLLLERILLKDFDLSDELSLPGDMYSPALVEILAKIMATRRFTFLQIHADMEKAVNDYLSIPTDRYSSNPVKKTRYQGWSTLLGRIRRHLEVDAMESKFSQNQNSLNVYGQYGNAINEFDLLIHQLSCKTISHISFALHFNLGECMGNVHSPLYTVAITAAEKLPAVIRKAVALSDELKKLPGLDDEVKAALAREDELLLKFVESACQRILDSFRSPTANSDETKLLQAVNTLKQAASSRGILQEPGIFKHIVNKVMSFNPIRRYPGGNN